MPAIRSARPSTPSTSRPVQSWTTSCRPTSTGRSSGCGSCSPRFRIPLVEVDGYEADDVIGTLADRAPGRGLAGRDRLGRQGLLSAHPSRHRAAQPRSRRAGGRRRGLGHRGECLRAARRAAGAGRPTISPWSATPSDNVPGVRGIGEKGAVAAAAASSATSRRCWRTPAEIKQKRAREALEQHGRRWPGCRAGWSPSGTMSPVRLDLETSLRHRGGPRRAGPRCSPSWSSTRCCASSVDAARPAPARRRSRRRARARRGTVARRHRRSMRSRPG